MVCNAKGMGHIKGPSAHKFWMDVRNSRGGGPICLIDPVTIASESFVTLDHFSLSFSLPMACDLSFQLGCSHFVNLLDHYVLIQYNSFVDIIHGLHNYPFKQELMLKDIGQLYDMNNLERE